MGIKVNFGGVVPSAEPGSGPVPEGEYLVLVDGAEQRTSQQGTPGMNLTLKILGGEFDGRKVWDDLWITQAALPYVLHRMQCLGTPIPQGDFELEPRALIGRKAKITVKHKDYQGKLQVRVVAWEPAAGAGGGAPDPLATTPANDPDIPF